jgi:hypothetical protein
MKHSDFKIGIEFMTATGRWRYLLIRRAAACE